MQSTDQPPEMDLPDPKQFDITPRDNTTQDDSRATQYGNIYEDAARSGSMRHRSSRAGTNRSLDTALGEITTGGMGSEYGLSRRHNLQGTTDHREQHNRAFDPSPRGRMLLSAQQSALSPLNPNYQHPQSTSTSFASSLPVQPASRHVLASLDPVVITSNSASAMSGSARAASSIASRPFNTRFLDPRLVSSSTVSDFQPGEAQHANNYASAFPPVVPPLPSSHTPPPPSESPSSSASLLPQSLAHPIYENPPAGYRPDRPLQTPPGISEDERATMVENRIDTLIHTALDPSGPYALPLMETDLLNLPTRLLTGVYFPRAGVTGLWATWFSCPPLDRRFEPEAVVSAEILAGYTEVQATGESGAIGYVGNSRGDGGL